MKNLLDDPSLLDAADADIVEVPGFVPDVVDVDPDPSDVQDLDEDSDQ
jgi:hypothetical protein